MNVQGKKWALKHNNGGPHLLQTSLVYLMHPSQI